MRATTTLARLLATQNRRDEACAMLAEIYNWFAVASTLPTLKTRSYMKIEADRLDSMIEQPLTILVSTSRRARIG